MAALDAHEHLLKLAVLVGERDLAVDAFVGAHLLHAADRLCVDEAERPPLELIAALVIDGELAGTFHLGRLADHVDVVQPEAVLEACLHDRNG